MLPPVTSWIIWAVLKLFWTNSIVLWSLQQFLQSPEGEGRTRRWESQNSNSPEGVREKKALLSYTAIMPDFSFSVLLSHRLLMFLSAVQSRGCRDILPLGQHYKELPARHSADFLHILDEWLYFSPEATPSEYTTKGLGTRSARDSDWHIHVAAYKEKQAHMGRKYAHTQAVTHMDTHGKAGRKIRARTYTDAKG